MEKKKENEKYFFVFEHEIMLKARINMRLFMIAFTRKDIKIFFSPIFLFLRLAMRKQQLFLPFFFITFSTMRLPSITKFSFIFLLFRVRCANVKIAFTHKSNISTHLSQKHTKMFWIFFKKKKPIYIIIANFISRTPTFIFLNTTNHSLLFNDRFHFLSSQKIGKNERKKNEEASYSIKFILTFLFHIL